MRRSASRYVLRHGVALLSCAHALAFLSQLGAEVTVLEISHSGCALGPDHRRELTADERRRAPCTDGRGEGIARASFDLTADLDAAELIEFLRECLPAGGQVAGRHHVLWVRAVDGEVWSPAARLEFDLIPLLDDAPVGEWFLDEEIDALRAGERPAGRSFTPPACAASLECFQELPLAAGLSGVHRVAFRLGAPLLGYELCFPSGVRAEVPSIPADPSVYWGQFLETRVRLLRTSNPQFHGLLATDEHLGEDCSAQGDQDGDGLDDPNDPECDEPSRQPLVELSFDASIGAACGAAALADFPQITGIPGEPRRAALHVYGVPGEAFAGDILLDLAPPSLTTVTPVASCEGRNGETAARVEWSPGAGFFRYEIELDGSVAAGESCGPRCAVVPAAPGVHEVRVIGFRPHPRIAEGVGYRSAPASVAVGAPCVDFSLERTPAGVRLDWSVPACSRFFDRLTVEIDRRPPLELDPGNGCFGGEVITDPSLLEGCHDFVVRGYSGETVLCCQAAVHPCAPSATFRRGDADGDGSVTLTDALATLAFLFEGASGATCTDALDANDNGRINVADVSYTLYFLFLGGNEPPAPFPECGSDPTPDAVDCLSGATCL